MSFGEGRKEREAKAAAALGRRIRKGLRRRRPRGGGGGGGRIFALIKLIFRQITSQNYSGSDDECTRSNGGRDVKRRREGERDSELHITPPLYLPPQFQELSSKGDPFQATPKG